jgi:hypothetical protein
VFFPGDVDHEAEVAFQAIIEEGDGGWVIEAEASCAQGLDVGEVGKEAGAIGEVVAGRVGGKWAVDQAFEGPDFVAGCEEFAANRDSLPHRVHDNVVGGFSMRADW